MTKKLTLNLKEETVARAERISKLHGKSISVLIEEYLNSIPDEKEELEETAMDKIKQIMAPYIGKLNLDENKSYKEMVGEWRYEDYLQDTQKEENQNI